jgi:peroxiredoxin
MKSSKRFLVTSLSAAALLFGCAGEPQKPADAPAASTQAAKRPKKAPRGDPMEPFELPTIAGSRYDSGELLGKRAAVIYFFATWYAGAADDLKALSETLKGRDVALIAVAIDSADSAAKVDAFVKENAVSVPVLLDPGGKLFEVRHTGIATAPATLVVSAKGELIAKRGPEEDEKEPLAKLLDSLKEAGDGE